MSLTAPQQLATEAASSGEGELDGAYPRLLRQLLKLTNLVGRPFFTHFAERHDLTLNDARVLMALAADGQAASHELCDATGMHPMNVSRSVARLRRQGRVTERTDPDNRRRKLLTTTDEGWTLARKLAPHVRALSEFVFATVSEREAEFLGSLVAVLSARLQSADLNSPQLIDAEALEREAAEAPSGAQKHPRRSTSASN